MLSVALLLNRLALGIYFALAGFHKIQGGVSTFYEKVFLPMKPQWLSDSLAMPYGYALPFAELIFGAALAIGFLARVSASFLFLMLVSFTIALMIMSGLSGGGNGVYHTNVILATLSLLLVVTGPGCLSIDRFIFGSPKQLDDD